jgi:hypothetical protein
MFLLARYTIAAAVFQSASAASAVEDETLSADRMLAACEAFIADSAPSEIDAGSGPGAASDLCKVLDMSRGSLAFAPDEVTLAQKARVAVTYVKARPERTSEDLIGGGGIPTPSQATSWLIATMHSR